MFTSRRRKDTPIVGLELDPGHIAAAQVGPGRPLSVERGAVAALRPGVLRDGEVGDAPALAGALRTLFAEHDLPRDVRLGIANQRIVVRTLDLPHTTDDKALAAAVKAEAPDHIPMPMDQAVVDWQSLGSVDTPAGPRTRVVVVAVRRELIEQLVGVARDADLNVTGIDLAAFGMVRALSAYSPGGAVLYVNVAGLTNVAVANEHGCLFTRAAAGGLDGMVQSLAERRNLTDEHARQWLEHVGLTAPLEAVDGDEELVAAARAVLEEGVHHLADTVRNSLNFYRTQQAAERVEQGLLTGPVTAIAGFAEALSAQLKVPIVPAVVASEAGDCGPERLTVAAGLAVEAA